MNERKINKTRELQEDIFDLLERGAMMTQVREKYEIKLQELRKF